MISLVSLPKSKDAVSLSRRFYYMWEPGFESIFTYIWGRGGLKNLGKDAYAKLEHSLKSSLDWYSMYSTKVNLFKDT